MRTDVKLGVVLGLAVLGVLAWWVTRDDDGRVLRIVDANNSPDGVETADAGAGPMPPPLFVDRTDGGSKTKATVNAKVKAAAAKQLEQRSNRANTKRGATTRQIQLAQGGANKRLSVDSVTPSARGPQLIPPPGTKVETDKEKKKTSLPTLDRPKAKKDAAKGTDAAKTDKTKLPVLPPIHRTKGPSTKPTTSTAKRAAKESKPPKLRMRVHTVEKYDSFAIISEKYYGTQRLALALLKANPKIKDPRRLKPGMKLRIPPKEMLLKPETDQKAGEASTKPGAKTASAERAPEAKKPAADKKPVGKKVYVVQKDDSFYAIARQLLDDGTRWKEIHALNKDVCPSPQDLRPGMKLRVPPK